MCKGASKQSPGLKNYTAPPGSKIPGSATEVGIRTISILIFLNQIGRVDVH